MATVVQFSAHTATQPPHKVLTTATSNNREIILLRKPPSILPKDTNHHQQQQQDDKQQQQKQQQSSSIKRLAKVNQPPVAAVARRNARERNRVKQVNNGFANLRQRIPNFIAAAFESNHGRGSGANKKLSKVETLRMAVEYIRSLEDLLAMDESGVSTASESNSGEEPTTPPPQQIQTSIPAPLLQSSVISSIPEQSQISGQQQQQQQQPAGFIRIDTVNNTFQIIPASQLMQFEEDDDDENMAPIDLNLEFGLLDAGDSLSPPGDGLYSSSSETSLSPTTGDGLDALTPPFVFNRQMVKQEPIDEGIALTNDNLIDHNQIGVDQDKQDVLDVIQWWETQHSPHNGISS